MEILVNIVTVAVVVVVGYLEARGRGGGDQFLSHHELRPSVGPVLNPYPHNTHHTCVYALYVCVYRHKAEVSAQCICVCCEQSLSSLF